MQNLESDNHHNIQNHFMDFISIAKLKSYNFGHNRITMSFDVEKIRTILATDCGSTTSKARFFKKFGNEYRYVTSGEAPTTVEAPYEDVTLGVRNAVREIEELTGHKLLFSEGIICPARGSNEGVDLYITTSSAGGGLQMMVSGIIRSMTAESAERAALGAGAIVMDVLSADDARAYE
jgi:hypothetical protein